MLMSKSIGGSGTDAASVVVVVVFVSGAVVSCVGPISDWWDRLENASDVVGTTSTVRSRTSEL